MNDVPNDDLTNDLRRQLAMDGDALPVDESDAAALAEAGRRRHRRNVVLGSAAAVVFVAGASWAGSSWLLGDDQPPSVTIQPLPSPTGTPVEPLTETPTPTPTPEPSATSAPTPTSERTPTSAPTPTPDPGATEPGPLPTTPSEPTETTSPTPTPTTPSPDPSPSPSADPARDGPSLVVATDDGVMLNGSRVANLDGPVLRAFDDGVGSVIFQRNPRGIGGFPDRGGPVETLVALADFAPRSFEDTTGGTEPITLSPTALRLFDVNVITRQPYSGFMVFGVEYRDPEGGPGPNDQLVIVESDVSGGNRRDIAVDATWEGATSVSLGGPNRLFNRSNEAGGALTVVPKDADPSGPTVELPYSFVEDDGPVWRGGQLSTDGSRLAATTVIDGSWHLLVRSVGDDEAGTLQPLPDDVTFDTAVVSDLHGDWVVVTGRASDTMKRVSLVLNLRSGSTEVIPGTATILG